MSDLAESADWSLRKSAFVPALVAFSLGSRHSLRAYLAAQQVGPAPEETDEQKRRGSLRRKLALLAFILLIGGGEFYLIYTENERVLAMCMRYMLAAFYQIVLTSTFADLTHAYKTAAYRTPMSLVFAPLRSSVSKSRLLVTVAIATGLNVATYLDLHYAAAMALSTAAIYRLISRAPSRTFSLRVYMIVLLAWLALTALISGVLVMYLVNYWMDGAAGDGTVAAGVEQGARPDGSMILTGYIGTYQTAMLAFAPGILIAACYRFDYANHVEANPELAQIATLETVAPSIKCRRAISDGVVLPQWDPVGFARPYFTTALWCWMLGMMASFGILSMAMPLSAEVLTMHTLDLVGLTLAIPFMVVGLALTASIRGEFKRMWTHKEVWFTKADDKAEGAIALPAGDAEEESLPAYEVDSDRESLDEKAPLVHVEATLA